MSDASIVPVVIIPDTHRGLYAVSEDGQVYSICNYKYPDAAIQMRPALDSRGYCQVRCAGKMFLVHRLVANAFIENQPAGARQVNHLDGCKTNNHVSNLEYVTCKENVSHSWATGLAKARNGERVNTAKLTAAQVVDIRARRARGEAPTDLAAEYGIDYTSVWNIVKRRTWAHI